nr:imidazole glycerol phosphate synthase subunit HisH [Quadrisphaera sp. INWT6]
MSAETPSTGPVTSATTAGGAGRRPRVVVLDHGSGNLRSAVRALERAGAEVELTADRRAAQEADGLVVPGVGAFETVVQGLSGVRGAEVVDRRLAGGRAVLGICVGMQVMFERGVEHGTTSEGLGEWPGTVERLDAPVVPHMGWNTVEPRPARCSSAASSPSASTSSTPTGCSSGPWTRTSARTAPCAAARRR